MEQSEGFRNAVAKIKALEEQLSLCDNALQGSDRDGVEKVIEDFFAQCMNALAARKQALLEDTAKQLSSKHKTIEDLKQKLSTSIAASNQTLAASAMVFSVDKNAAEMVWKGIASVVVPQVNLTPVVPKLPTSLLDWIKKGGEDSQQAEQNSTTLATESVAPRLVPNFIPISPAFKLFNKPKQVEIFAGSVSGMKDGNGGEAQFAGPIGICVNNFDDCLYVVEQINHTVRKISLDGIVSTTVNPNDGLIGPSGIVVGYAANDFFIVDCAGNSVIKKMSKSLTYIYPSIEKTYDVRLNHPWGIAMHQGLIFVSDSDNHAIRLINHRGGDIATLAGSKCGYADGKEKNAKFNQPAGICYIPETKILIVCDYGNNKLRQITTAGEVSTLCEIPSPQSIATIRGGSVLFVTSAGHLYRVSSKNGTYVPKLIVADSLGNSDSIGNLGGIALHEKSNSCYISASQKNLILKISFQ